MERLWSSAPAIVYFVDGYERTSRQFPVSRYSVPFYRNTFSLLIYIACLKTSKRMCISVLWDKHPEQSGTRSAPFLMKTGLENMNEWSYVLLDTVTFSRSIILLILLSMQFQDSIKKRKFSIFQHTSEKQASLQNRLYFFILSNRGYNTMKTELHSRHNHQVCLNIACNWMHEYSV